MWSLLICSVYLLISATAIVGQRQFRCDYQYLSAIKGWLKYHEMPSNWNEARLRCHMEGAFLASPLNDSIKQAMLKMLRDQKNNNCGVFTGIHATFSRGDFASIEGVPLSKIPHTWEKNEPDNYKDQEDCLMMLPNGNMADVPCKDAFPYFCFKKSTGLVVNGCGTVDPEYNLDTRTGKCYKFHKVPRTWSRAYMNCMAEGAHLAIINSDKEATVISQLFGKYPAGSMVGNFWKDVAFVGFQDWTEHGEWRTIQGETLFEAGYEKFSAGEPNNATTGEYCGAVYRSALLLDVTCESKYAFICEKDPASLACNSDETD